MLSFKVYARNNLTRADSETKILGRLSFYELLANRYEDSCELILAHLSDFTNIDSYHIYITVISCVVYFVYDKKLNK